MPSTRVGCARSPTRSPSGRSPGSCAPTSRPSRTPVATRCGSSAPARARARAEVQQPRWVDAADVGDGRGQLLVMPSTNGRAAGVKVLTVAPGNPARGLDRIQAVYVLMDADTLAPSVLVDGTAVTSLRTPAVSAVAIDALAPDEVESAVIFGSGPQALGHAEALLAIRPTTAVTVVGRRGDAARATAQRISGLASTHRLTTRGLTVDDPQEV